MVRHQLVKRMVRDALIASLVVGILIGYLTGVHSIFGVSEVKYYCGNGIKEGSEQCDTTVGFCTTAGLLPHSGLQHCKSDCTFDTCS